MAPHLAKRTEKRIREIAKSTTLALHETKHFFTTPYFNIVPRPANLRSDVSVQSFAIGRNKLFSPGGSDAVGYGSYDALLNEAGDIKDGSKPQKDRSSGFIPYPLNMTRTFPDPTNESDFNDFLIKYNLPLKLPERYKNGVFENICRKNALEGHELQPSVAKVMWTFTRPKIRMLNDAYTVDQINQDDNVKEDILNLGSSAAGIVAGFATGSMPLAATSGINFSSQIIDIATDVQGEENNQDGVGDEGTTTPTDPTSNARRKLNYTDDALFGAAQPRDAETGMHTTQYSNSSVSNATFTDAQIEAIQSGFVLPAFHPNTGLFDKWVFNVGQTYEASPTAPARIDYEAYRTVINGTPATLGTAMPAYPTSL